MSRLSTTPTLDRLAAWQAQNILKAIKSLNDNRKKDEKELKAKEVFNLATKALGVLQENGIYAAALFLLSRSDRERKLADCLMDAILLFLARIDEEMGFKWGPCPHDNPKQRFQDILPYLADTVAAKMQPLLLAKEALEQMLIYTRYGAQAWDAEGG